VHHRFLFDNYGRADRRVIEKRLRHFARDTNAAVRRGVGRDIALMHGVTTAEEHRKRHPCAVIMRARRSRILARIDIRFHDVAHVVHVIAENGRDVRGILRQNCVMAGRSAEARLARRDGRFADEILAFKKISVLLGDTDDDLRRTRNAVAVPIADWRRSWRGGCRRGRVFNAAGQKGQDGQGTESSNDVPASHLDAQSNASSSRFNPKDLSDSCDNDAETGRLRSCSGAVPSCPKPRFLIPSPA